MKKSSIIVKILLALVVLSLAFALVACGDKNKDDNGGNGGGGGETPPAGDKDLAAYLTEIINSANGLLSEVKEIKRDSNVYANVGVGLDINAGKFTGKGELSVEGNINNENPSAVINLNIENEDWFTLGYIDGTGYLAQPLTKVNGDKTWGDVERVKLNAAGIDKAIVSAVDVVMIYLDDLVKNTLGSFSLDSIVEMLQGEDIQGFLPLVQSFIDVEKVSTGYTLDIGAGIIGVVMNFVPENISGTINNVLGENGLFLRIEIGITNNMIDSLKINVQVAKTKEDQNDPTILYMDGEPTATIGLNVNLGLDVGSTKTPSVPQASKFENKALNLNVGAKADAKKSEAKLEVYASNNMLSAADAVAGYAKLTLNNKVSEGYASGKAVYFNTNAIEGIGVAEATAQKNYKAVLPLTKKDSTDTYASVVEMINDMAKNWVTETEKAVANKKPTQSGDNNPSGGDQGDAGKTEETKTTLESIIAGLLKMPEPEKATEATLLAFIRDKEVNAQTHQKVSDFIRFEIGSTYVGTAWNIVKLLAQNDTWIIGGDYLDENASVTGWADFLKIGKEVKDPATYGIFNWDTTNYKGGVALSSSASKQDDLLDAVNVFGCNGKTEGAPNDITLDTVVGALNGWILMLENYLPDSVTVEGADNTAKANAIVKGLLGIDGGLAAVKNSLYLQIGSTKGDYLNGFIALLSAADDAATDTVTYAKVSLGIKFVENNIESASQSIRTAMSADGVAITDLTSVTVVDGLNTYPNASALVTEMSSDWLSAWWDYTGVAA